MHGVWLCSFEYYTSDGLVSFVKSGRWISGSLWFFSVHLLVTLPCVGELTPREGRPWGDWMNDRQASFKAIDNVTHK